MSSGVLVRKSPMLLCGLFRRASWFGKVSHSNGLCV